MIRSSQYTDARAAQRYQALNAASGYYAETFPRASASLAQAMASGTIYLSAIGLLAGDVVTNICTVVQTLGSGFSGINMKAGIYSKAGVQLAVTGDISAAHGSTGAKVNALTAPYTVLTTDAYYVAALSIATTGPSLIREIASNAAGVAFAGATIGCFATQVGQTDLTAPVTLAFNNGGTAYWFGVS